LRRRSTEARLRLRWHLTRDSIRRRFEQNQTDCTITVLALLPTLTENIIERLPVEQLTNDLQQKRAERLARASGEGLSDSSSLRDGDTASISSFQTGSFVHTSQVVEADPNAPRKSKAQIWNEIKITSITRALTMIYSLSLLTLLTRIQLNLLGRGSYVASVVALAQPPPDASNSILLEDHDDPSGSTSFGDNWEVNRRYLTFSYYLLHKGYAQVMEKVRRAVQEAFGSVSPTEGLSADRLRELILSVRKQIEGPTETERYSLRWLPFLLPSREEEEALLIEANVITPPQTSSSSPGAEGSSLTDERKSYLDTSTGPLRHLLDETADLIDSPSFTRIHTLLLNSMFSHLIDDKVIATAYPQPNVQSPPASDSSAPYPRIQELDSAVTVVPAEPRVKLANILAIITRQAHAIGKGNEPPNEYLAKADAEVRDLDSFAAVIYTNNQETNTAAAGPCAQPESGVKAAEGLGVSDVGPTAADEMVESQLESAWAKVTSSSFSSR
jgi:peroxin-3